MHAYLPKYDDMSLVLSAIMRHVYRHGYKPISVQGIIRLAGIAVPPCKNAAIVPPQPRRMTPQEVEWIVGKAKELCFVRFKRNEMGHFQFEYVTWVSSDAYPGEDAVVLEREL